MNDVDVAEMPDDWWLQNSGAEYLEEGTAILGIEGELNAAQREFEASWREMATAEQRLHRLIRRALIAAFERAGCWEQANFHRRLNGRRRVEGDDANGT